MIRKEYTVPENDFLFELYYSNKRFICEPNIPQNINKGGNCIYIELKNIEFIRIIQGTDRTKLSKL